MDKAAEAWCVLFTDALPAGRLSAGPVACVSWHIMHIMYAANFAAAHGLLLAVNYRA